MFNIDPLYIFINLVLLLIFVSMGRYAEKGGSYKFASGVCIIAFTLVLGSRYMRGNDYAHYIEVFNRRTEADQHLFTWLNDFLAVIGINAYGSFFVYAFIFSCSLFYLLRRYKPYAAYMFPLALIALIFFHEYMIRQALGFSFVFMFIDQLLTLEGYSKVNMADGDEPYESLGQDECVNSKFPAESYFVSLADESQQLAETYPHDVKMQESKRKSYFLCILFVVCTMSVHTANMIVIGLVAFFALLMRRRTIPFYVAIPSMLVCSLFINKIIDFDVIAPYVNLLQGTNTKFDTYIENSDYWFGEEGVSNAYTRKIYILYLELWGYSVLFWLADRMSRHMDLGYVFATLLNITIVGSLIMMTFRELEIIHRIGYVLTMLWFIPLSICLYHLKDFEFKIWEKIPLLGLFWWLYEYIKYLFMRTDGMTSFLWDMQIF